MVLGTGTARWMCAVPSPSTVVSSSAGGACAPACQADAAGKINNDARDFRLVIRLIISHPGHNRDSIRIRAFSRSPLVEAHRTFSKLVGCGRWHMEVQHRHALFL